ncbi:MAG: hypothetical protein ACOY46_18850 [Bacillota bacterium]
MSDKNRIADNKSMQSKSDLEKTVQNTDEKILVDRNVSNEEIRVPSENNTSSALPKTGSNFEQIELDLKSVEQVQLKAVKETKASNNQKKYKKHNNTRSNPKQNSPVIPPGILLEYRIKRLVFNLGYYPRMGIDLKTSYGETADKITDLDVYGIYIHKDFTTKTLWADCKSGEVKIHDRLSWIKGVMGSIQINDVILVAGGVRTSVKQYARKSGIQILGLNIIEKLEQQYDIKSDDWRGSWNPDTQFNKIITLSRISIPLNEQYKKIANFISSDYWVMDNYSKAKKALTALRELSSVVSIPTHEEQSKAIKWAIYDLIVMFLLATLNISKELYYFSDSEKKETIYEGLSSGDLPNKKRAEIIDAAFRYVYNTLKNQVPDFQVPSKMPTINLNPPSYSDAFFNLILRITSKPSHYFDILRFMDFVLMEYDLNEKPYNENELKAMFNNYDAVLIGAKTLLHFICHTTDISRTSFCLLR